MAAQTVMGFDYGRRRIGVAVGQTVSRTAEPLDVVENKNGQPDWRHLQMIVDDWQPERFVIGLPVTADGNKTDFHLEIETFAEQLAIRFGRPTQFCDERLSSYAAEQLDVNRKVGADALAAKLILESWFEENREAATAR